MSTGTAVWAWSGDLDSADAPAMAGALQDRLAQHPATLVIDVGAVTFMDCRILSLLLRANNDPSTTLVLRDVPVCVRRLLRATGLGATFRTTGT